MRTSVSAYLSFDKDTQTWTVDISAAYAFHTREEAMEFAQVVFIPDDEEANNG